MATTEELIRQAQILPLSVESDEKCLIDPETREITVPETYRLLGVESDEKAERIEFQCPKVVGDNINLSQLQIRINYQNANGEKDQYIVTDLESDIENITFSWLLSRKVTAYKGEVRFIVCAVKISGETITNEWNTTIATAEVLEGLEVDTPSPTEQESDVIAQLLQIMKDTSDQAVEAVESAETIAKDAIEDYTNQMKATIPEDYTEMVQKVKILERTKAPAIYQTATGNPITLIDSADGVPVVDFAMQGKTEQVQTTGAQLLKPPKKLNETLSNITWKYINGYVIADGSTNADSVSNYYIVGSYTEYENIGLVAGAYTLSGNIPPGTEFIIKANSGEQYTINNSVTQIDFTIKNEETYRMFYRVKENTSVANAILKVMINSGSESLPWEPYTGGQPSPSPDYPQEIVNSGNWNDESQKWEYEVKVQGKNLIPFPYLASDKTQNGLTFTVQEDGGVKVNGTATATTFFNFCKIHFGDSNMTPSRPSNGEYAISGSVEGANVQYDINNDYTYITISNGTTVNNQIIYPQVEYGTEPTPYEKYRSQTVLLQSDRPLTKWDRLEKRAGQWGWVFKSGKTELDGSEDENWSYHSEGRYWNDIQSKKLSALGGEKTLICDKLRVRPTNTTVQIMENNTIKEHGIPGFKSVFICVKETGNDVASLRAWLQSNPLTIWYETAEETFVPLTESEQTALEALATYFPTTIITVWAGELAPEIEMKYVADTKTYVDQKIQEFIQQSIAGNLLSTNSNQSLSAPMGAALNLRLEALEAKTE